MNHTNHRRTEMGRAFESIRAGLEQAVDHARGEPVRAVVHEIGPLDVKAIRDRLDMSQTEFAASFGISVGTLRHWERGARRPRSEEHTSELQSRGHLGCRLLLERKKSDSLW